MAVRVGARRATSEASPKAPLKMLIRVMPTCTVDRKRLGSSASLMAVRAPRLPSPAIFSRRRRLAETTASSDIAKMPLSKMRARMMMMSAMRILSGCRPDHRTAAIVRQRAHDSQRTRMAEEGIKLAIPSIRCLHCNTFCNFQAGRYGTIDMFDGTGTSAAGRPSALRYAIHQARERREGFPVRQYGDSADLRFAARSRVAGDYFAAVCGGSTQSTAEPCRVFSILLVAGQ
jgi:hypothetical protein